MSTPAWGNHPISLTEFLRQVVRAKAAIIGAAQDVFAGDDEEDGSTGILAALILAWILGLLLFATWLLRGGPA